jgi:hypothetical protein
MFNDPPTGVDNMIAHIWKSGETWLLELATGNSIDGFVVVSAVKYPSRAHAKAAAKLAGATPWNY